MPAFCFHKFSEALHLLEAHKIVDDLLIARDVDGKLVGVVVHLGVVIVIYNVWLARLRLHLIELAVLQL